MLYKLSIRACIGTSHLPVGRHQLHLTDEKTEDEKEKDQQGTWTVPELPTGLPYPHCLSPTQGREEPCYMITPAFLEH